MFGAQTAPSKACTAASHSYLYAPPTAFPAIPQLEQCRASAAHSAEDAGEEAIGAAVVEDEEVPRAELQRDRQSGPRKRISLIWPSTWTRRLLSSSAEDEKVRNRTQEPLGDRAGHGCGGGV
jgi:hypothetical protein